MTFNIEFDYRFDTGGFFDDPARRAALEAAAGIWESHIDDEFDDVPAGTTFSIHKGVYGPASTVTLTEPIDDLRIFVSSGYLNGPVALGGYDGVDVSGDVFASRVSHDYRGQGPVENFEPWAGSMTFDPRHNWSFDLDGPVRGAIDFVTVALHEMGHVLGVGTAPTFRDQVEGGLFYGENARSENQGQPVPISSGGGHVSAGFLGDTVLMDPSITTGQRTLPGDIDLAILADIGYEIDGFTSVGGGGDGPTTQGDDSPVFGSDGPDRIDGMGGDDQLLGAKGGDTLIGGDGNDTLFGQDGDDHLTGGRGDDRMVGGDGRDTLVGGSGEDTMSGDDGRDTFRIEAGGGRVIIHDFDLSGETLVLGGSGFANPAAALASVTKPYVNISRITFDDGTQVDVFHGAQDGTPLGTANLVIDGSGGGGGQQPGNAGPDLIPGTSGDDVIDSGAGNDTVIGYSGDDRIDGGSGADFLRGGTGDDTIEGGYGTDRVFMGGGDDLFIDNDQGGPFGRDTVFGNGGDDRLRGGGGDDVFYGKSGNDTLSGGTGDDRLFGGRNADRIFAGSGDDTVAGGNGRDRAFLGDGDDIWYDKGGDRFGDDTVIGGRGDDRIHSRNGDDTLFGGTGDDEFVFAAGIGEVTVRDFDKGDDTLELDDALWAGNLSASQVVDRFAEDVGGDVLLDFGDGHTILLEGLSSTAGLAEDLHLF